MYLKEEEFKLIINELKQMRIALMTKQKVLDKPVIGEEEFNQMFGINNRIAKTWRETGVINYLTPGDKILYAVRDVEALLNKNYTGENPINLNNKLNHAA